MTEPPKVPGCCGECSGTGKVNDPNVGGVCWDCWGTGHAHPGPCEPDPTLPEEQR